MEYFWNDPDLVRLLSKINMSQIVVPVGSTRDSRGEIKVVSNNSIIIDRIGHMYYQKGICLRNEDMIEAIFESGEIEVCGKKDDFDANFMGICELHEENDVDWKFIDDTTGYELNSKAVGKARAEEMKGFKEKKVYTYVKKEVAKADKEGKIVGVRWVDILKGNDVRSRLVAQEFASSDERDDIFAATPPLAATKVLLSDFCSRSAHGCRDLKIMILDVKKAFLYGDIEDKIYIKLPAEDPMAEEGYFGLLKKAMYGTRGAPLAWQKLVKAKLESLGFISCIVVPTLFYHPEKNIKIVTHVDVF